MLAPRRPRASGATGRAGRAFAALLGSTLLASAAGGALGRTFASSTCAPGDDCGLTVLAWLLVGCVAGALLGYAVTAMRHVLAAAQLGAASAPTAPTMAEPAPHALREASAQPR